MVNNGGEACCILSGYPPSAATTPTHAGQVDSLNIDWQAFREGQRAPATEAVGSAIVLDEIAKRDNIVVTEEDIDGELQRYAQQTGHTVPSIKARLQKDGELGRLTAGLRREKAVSLVISRAKITKS